MVDWSACPEIESVPDRVSGNWVFRGSRLPVYSLFENLAGGATIHDFMEWFGGVDEADVKAVLEFVAQDLRGEEMIASITPENRHEEWDLGPPQGKEIW